MVSAGELVAFAEVVNVSVDVPWWAWAFPGAIPGLAIALEGGREKARESGHAATSRESQGLRWLLESRVPNAQRLRIARIGGSCLVILKTPHLRLTTQSYLFCLATPLAPPIQPTSPKPRPT